MKCRNDCIFAWNVLKLFCCAYILVLVEGNIHDELEILKMRVSSVHWQKWPLGDQNS